jgi:hypothetical protein
MNSSQKPIVLEASHAGRRFVIEEDQPAGFYICAFEADRCTHDYLQDTVSVPGFPSAIETRSLPTLARSYPRRFTFYVAWPAAPFARLTHSRRIVVQR